MDRRRTGRKKPSESWPAALPSSLQVKLVLAVRDQFFGISWTGTGHSQSVRLVFRQRHVHVQTFAPAAAHHLHAEARSDGLVLDDQPEVAGLDGRRQVHHGDAGYFRNAELDRRAESHVSGLDGESVVDLGHRAAVDGLAVWDVRAGSPSAV